MLSRSRLTENGKNRRITTSKRPTRSMSRALLNRSKAVHGDSASLNVFDAVLEAVLSKACTSAVWKEDTKEHLQDEPTDLSMSIIVDGQVCDNLLFSKHASAEFAERFVGAVSGKNTILPFCFAKAGSSAFSLLKPYSKLTFSTYQIALTHQDDVATSSETIVKGMGTIRAIIFRTRNGEPDPTHKGRTAVSRRTCVAGIRVLNRACSSQPRKLFTREQRKRNWIIARPSTPTR